MRDGTRGSPGHSRDAKVLEGEGPHRTHGELLHGTTAATAATILYQGNWKLDAVRVSFAGCILCGYPGMYPYTLGVTGCIPIRSGGIRVYIHVLWE